MSQTATRSEAQIYDELNAVFRQVLEDDSIELTPSTTADDVEGWDSMSHILIVVELEKRFGVKFHAAEMEELKNVGELASLLQAKLAKRS